MRYSEGRIGRIFVVSLDDGDRLPLAIEDFAAKQDIKSAMCMLIGGIDGGGEIVVGPRERDVMPAEPTLFVLNGVHEVLAVGTIFPDSEGRPRLHMHAALGREGQTRAGCIRPGVEVWKLGEFVVLEIVDTIATRKRNPATGFDILDAGGQT